MLWYRKATYKDILAIGPCLREADRSEFQVASCLTAVAALKESYKYLKWRQTIVKADLWCVLDGTTPVALFGTSGYMTNDMAVVWMCGTDLIQWKTIEFLKASREVMQDILRPFSMVFNEIDSRNTVHIAWLEWLGFTIHRDCPVEIRGVPFYPFEYEYKPCAYQQPQ